MKIERSLRIATLLVVAALMPFFTACNRLWSDIEPVSGSGHIVNSGRDVQPFDAVEFDGGFEVILTQSPATTLQIETDSNLLSYIKSEVESGKLVIHSEGNLHPTKDIILHLSSPAYRSIEIAGSSQVHATTPISSNDLSLAIHGSGVYDMEVHVGKLHSDIAGSGKFLLHGSASSHIIDVAGSGDIHADSLQTESTKVDISGSGKAVLQVSRELDATVSGSGHVRYKGSVSQLHTSIAGSGSVEKIAE